MHFGDMKCEAALQTALTGAVQSIPHLTRRVKMTSSVTYGVYATH